MPEGVNDNGLTLTGFIFLHALFIEKGRLETTWTVLRKFGYDNDIKLRDDLIPTAIKRSPDQTLELTNEVVDFLRGIFNMFDVDNDGAMLPAELEDLFSTAPENPWSSDLYKDSAEKNVLGGLSLEGFLSKWALMTLLDPANSFANLIYVGYSGDFNSAFTITRKRRLDRKKQQTQRNVFQCYVFGPKGAGKTVLLQSFLGSYSMHFPEVYTMNFLAVFVSYFLLAFSVSLAVLFSRQPSDALPTNSERFAANTVQLSDVNDAIQMLERMAHRGA